ncbi:TerD family protein [Janthinobacterium sp. HLX7-2]|uniref:TerD family protein n=1 Tax=Janthinobacterium sp. HLX7-2 TaxID=1259331 RepID=UPI003F2658BC
MENLIKGQRLALSGLVTGNALQLGIKSAGVPLDFACFGLDANGKLSDERYMTFFNQPRTPCGGVETSAPAGDAAGFSYQLDRLPASIQRLVVTVAVEGAATMAQLGSGYVRLLDGGRELARFAFSGLDFAQEKAVMLGEFYRKDGAWRFMAVGQGFNGGLDALVAHFGGEVAPQVAEPVPEPIAPKISLSKISLTKAGQTHKVSLEKGAGAPKKLTVKATWVDNGDGDDDNDDLDLRVGILLPNGKMRFIQAPDTPGHFDAMPFVRHLGDVAGASGKEPATETVEVNPALAQHYGGTVGLVFSVYSALANGAVPVASMRPKMVMQYGEQIVECAFDFRLSKAAEDDTVYTYVIGMARITPDSITLEPSGKTSEPGSEATPWLSWQGEGLQLAFNGPVVFKGEAKEDEDDFNADNPRRYIA